MKKHLWKIIAVVVVLAGVAYGVRYITQHTGGSDIVSGYGSGQMEAVNDAKRKLDEIYSSYEIVHTEFKSETSKPDYINTGTYTKTVYQATVHVQKAVKR
jgi:hypothetical protein